MEWIVLKKSNKLTLASCFLEPTDNRPFYTSPALIIIQLYFFTGFLANYTGLVNVNNAILLVCALLLLAKRFFRETFTPLITCYSLLTLLSLINHLIFWPDAGLPSEARTMPIVLLMMIVCRQFAKRGLFVRAASLNALPFIMLIPIGGSFEGGRYYSVFLSENMQGHVLQFAFAIGSIFLINKHFKLIPILAFVASVMQVFLGAGRRLFLFFILGVFSAISSVRKIKLYQFILMAVILIVTIYVAVPLLIERQTNRFGGDFNVETMITNFILGEALDKSSHDRRAFIEIAFTATSDHWLGFGNGNFSYVVSEYGNGFLPEASHPHSGLAEALITAGYVGLFLYAAMLGHLVKIGWRDPIIRIVLIWLFLQIFVETTLNNRFIWPLLAIAEWEILNAKNTKTSASKN